MSLTIRIFFYLTLLLPFLISSCSKKDISDTPGDTFANGTVELPALRNGADDRFITHYTTFNGKRTPSFSMEYDKSKKHSRWVAFRFDNRTNLRNVGRSNEPFAPDPAISEQYQRIQADFGRRGYDRGHLCASADRLYSAEANEQTFYYTNMSPQRHKFNAGIWLDLEGQVQSWGRSCTATDTLYVVKGGTIDRTDQIREYIGNDRTKPVPKYYLHGAFVQKSLYLQSHRLLAGTHRYS